MNISTFKSQVDSAGGLARLNRFQVFVPIAALTAGSANISNAIQSNDEFPSSAGNDWMSDFASGGADYYRLTAFCRETELPGYQFQTDTQRIYGPVFKYPHMPEWADVNMTFYCGADMQEKVFFQAWMYMVMDPESNNFNYRTEYAADMNIVMYDETDTINYIVTLVSAYPIAIGPIQLSYENDNSVATMQVTFTYRKAQDYIGAAGNATIQGQQVTFGSTISGGNGAS